jgi:predicted restriction endonuclease
VYRNPTTILIQSNKQNFNMENWRIILDKARKALSSHVEWKSLGEQTKYRFKEIEDERIKIELLGGGKDVTIGHMGAIRAMNKLRLNGSLYKSELITGVVRQTALVFLHPYIHYDHRTKRISWKDFIQAYINEATDDELTKIQRLINERKNQSKFRSSILSLYNGQCAITKTAADKVLEAAHIIPHADSGINKNDNGILLRKDIHTLFDNYLIRINPYTMKIEVDSSVKDRIYTCYNDTEINLPIKDKQYLEAKWKGERE